MDNHIRLEKRLQISKYELSDDEFLWTHSYLADKLGHELDTFTEICDNDGTKVIVKPKEVKCDDKLTKQELYTLLRTARDQHKNEVNVP